MRSYLCAKISLAMFLDSICLQSTVNSPFSRSIFSFPFILLISTGREQKSWLSTRQRVRGHIIPLGLGQSPDFLRNFHSHCGAKASPLPDIQSKHSPSLCGPLWLCSVETLSSFQELWDHRSGLLDWPLLTRVQKPWSVRIPFLRPVVAVRKPLRRLFGLCSPLCPSV